MTDNPWQWRATDSKLGHFYWEGDLDVIDIIDTLIREDGSDLMGVMGKNWDQVICWRSRCYVCTWKHGCTTASLRGKVNVIWQWNEKIWGTLLVFNVEDEMLTIAGNAALLTVVPSLEFQ